MRRFRTHLSYSPFTVASAIMLMATAHAQSAGTGSTAAPARLEEVTVTAQRRTENLQKTAVAVTAVSASTLKVLNVTTAQDLTAVVSNLTVGSNGASAQIGMRGAMSTTAGTFADQAVGFSIDGVYIARGGSALTSLYDISQIEVLRGPQGTLYGRNTIAGLVNVITAKPKLNRYEGNLSVGYGNYNDIQTSGMLNIPITPDLALRGAFSTDKHDGYSKNSPGPNYNDLNSLAGRVEAYYRPLDSFNAQITASVYHDTGVGGGGITGGEPLGVYAASAGASPYNYQEPRAEAYTNELTKDVMATLNYEMPWATATFVSSYREDNYAGEGNLAVQGPIALTFPAGLCADASDPTCFSLATKNDSTQISDEFRLGHTSDRLKWVLGAYYFQYADNNLTTLSPCPCGQTFDIYSPGRDVETTHAVFGQSTVTLVPRLRLTLGARYNDEFKETENLTETAPGGSVSGFNCTGCAPAGSWEGGNTDMRKWTWRIGLDGDITPNTMTFLSIANGFKNGGINNDGSVYKPEVILNYEMGVKSDLYEHRLQIDLDAFRELYTNYQSTAGELVGDTVNLVTVNAGKASIDGAELETAALLTPSDRIGFNATYLYARFTDFYLPHGDGFDDDVAESLTGKRVPYAPMLTLRGSYQHTFLLDSGATIVPGADFNFVTSQELDYHNFPATYVPAYTRSGVSLTYNAPEVPGHVTWSVMAWAKNLENHAVLVTGQVDNTLPQSLVGQGGKDGFYLAPRTYGVKFTGSF